MLLCLGFLALFIPVLSQPLAPGQAEYFAASGRTPLPSYTPNPTLLNINEASVGELMELPGIGEVLALSIIEWRETEGPFRYPGDLARVKGIGIKTLEVLRPLIRLE